MPKQKKMDRYVIINPQPSSSKSPTKSGSPKLRQVTIESMKGVVVIDDILHHKSKLQLSTSTKQEKLKSLQELGKKIPPRHVMMDTKIGRVVSKLRSDEDDDIRKAAKQVYVKWKSHFVEHMERPMIEVKCDLKTERLRTSGRNLLAGALQVQETHSLPDTIERETFQVHKRLLSGAYRRTIRHIVFTLKNQEDLRSKVTSGEVTVTDLVKDYKKS